MKNARRKMATKKKKSDPQESGSSVEAPWQLRESCVEATWKLHGSCVEPRTGRLLATRLVLRLMNMNTSGHSIDIGR